MKIHLNWLRLTDNGQAKTRPRNLNILMCTILKRANHVLVGLIMACIPSTLYAEWYNQITFTVGSDAETPVTVRYNGKNYTVSSTLTINTTGNTYTPSGTDAAGNSMRYEFQSKTETRGADKYHYYTYTFFPQERSREAHPSNQYNNDSMNWGNDPRWGGVGRGLSDAASRHAENVSGKAYPGLHLLTGVSKAYGEFARLRLVFSAMNIYAGIGKDWLFDGVNKDKLLWHAGIGGLYHFGGVDPWGDIGGAVTVARTAPWENISLMIDCDFTYWFGRWKRVGCFVGAGAGFADIKDAGKDRNESGFAWNIEIGLTFRLANF